MEGQGLLDIKIVAGVLKGLLDLSGDLKLDEVLGEGVEVGQIVVLVVLLNRFG